MNNENIINLLKTERERQRSLGWTDAHDKTHASLDWSALLAKLAGDVAFGAHFETEEGDDLYWHNLIQLTTTALVAMGYDFDS